MLPIVISGMALAAGGYHLVIGFSLGRRREHLSFAALCLAIVVYALLSARLYAASSPADGAIFQRWQVVALCLGSLALLELVAAYTGRVRQLWRGGLAATYLAAAAVAVLFPVPWVLGETPDVKRATLPMVGVAVTYQEVEAGPLLHLLGLVSIGLLAVVLHAGVALYRAGDRERARPLLVALGLFFVGVVNDAAVGSGLITSVYLIEYGFLGLVALMAYSLSRNVLQAAAAEAELRDSRARFRAMVETSSDLVWEVDADIRYTYVSPRVREVLGYEPEELIGRRPFELMPEDEAARVRAFFEPLAAQSAPFVMLENVNLHRDGRRVVLESSGAPRFDADGRLAGYRGIDRDITEHQQAFEALKQSEQRFRILADNLPGVVYLCRDDPSWTMLYLNDAVEALTGWPKVDFLSGQVTYAALCHPDDQAGMRAEIAAASGEDRPFRLHYRVRRRDGGERRVEEIGVAVRGPSGEALLEGYIRDVTDRDRLEEQLRHAQKMEAVGRLAGGVAHDFNNLLQAIRSHADAMRSMLDRPDRLAEGLGDLVEQARRGARLTRQLLLFSRRDSSRRELLDLTDAIAGGVRLVRRLLREDIELELELGEAPLPVVGDRGQLEQVLMNLTLNAADALPRGGRITVRTTRAGALARLEVVDTGVGISAEVRDRIFEPFFTTKGPGQGSGLGLSVVHGIVASHGGTVELAATGDAGSTFVVTLPLTVGRAGPTAPQPRVAFDREERRKGGAVLLVEDDPGARAALVELLESLGWHVVQAESVGEALSCSWDSGFDLLLSDFLLPDGRGHELAATLQQRHPGLATILMSGYADSPELEAVVESGTVGFLRKPFGIQALTQEIERVRAIPRAGL